MDKMTPHRTLRLVLSSALALLMQASGAVARGQEAFHIDPVLSLAPGEQSLVAYTIETKSLSNHPLLGLVEERFSGVKALMRTLVNTFDGPAMIALNVTTSNPPRRELTLAAHTQRRSTEIFSRLSSNIVPVWNRSGLAERIGKLTFTRSGDTGLLDLEGTWNLSLTVAVRDDVVMISSAPGLAQRWRGGERPGDPFTSTPGFSSLARTLSGSLESLIFIDPGVIQPTFLEPTLRGLPLSNLPFVAVTTTGPARPTLQRLRARTGQARKKADVRVTLGLGDHGGAWEVFAGEPVDRDLLKYFPWYTTALFTGSMSRGVDIIDDLGVLAKVIDASVAGEYLAERLGAAAGGEAQLRSNVLSNLVEQWAFGATMEPDGFRDILLAVKVRDAKAFEEQLDTLRTIFQIDIATNRHGGFTIHHGRRIAGRFSYALVRDVLLVAPEPQMIAHGIDAAMENNGISRTRQFPTVMQNVPDRASAIAYLDVGEVAYTLRDLNPDANESLTAALQRLRSPIAVTFTPYDRLLAIDVKTGQTSGSVDTAALWQTVVAWLNKK